MARTKNLTVKNVKATAKANATKANATKKTQSTKVNKEEKTMAKNTKAMQLTAEEIEMVKAARAKAEAKANAKPFDRERYESIANALEVLGKNGVYKFARPTVYKLMDMEKITKTTFNNAKKELEKIAKEQELTWFLEQEEADAIAQ